MDERWDVRFGEMDERWTARISGCEHKVDQGVQGLRQEMLEMETRLMWRFVALLSAFAAVITALDLLVS